MFPTGGIIHVCTEPFNKSPSSLCHRAWCMHAEQKEEPAFKLFHGWSFHWEVNGFSDCDILNFLSFIWAAENSAVYLPPMCQDSFLWATSPWVSKRGASVGGASITSSVFQAVGGFIWKCHVGTCSSSNSSPWVYSHHVAIAQGHSRYFFFSKKQEGGKKRVAFLVLDSCLFKQIWSRSFV